ncbi:hypothetical protein CJ199_02095 [Brevibacterium paucivorans]|uniref:Uncharacterized protein n=1 Tax=Brevibacterium paucivorans TaxID=170994 RepID=A0A2N6VPY0_9MICO|nr:hypothetical protein CJ199_02095 [Brevibacterium paucivorans]
MQVRAPTDSSTRAVLADWVELQVLLSEGPVAEQQLIRSQAAQSEPDHGNVLTEPDLEAADEEILETSADELSQRVHEELVYRESVLGPLYPFEMTVEYGKWALGRRDTSDSSEQAAHGAYVCCLLIAAMHSELLPISSQHSLFTRSAKIMQIESYLTAAEILGGSAYWFGYPRPDHSNMLTAVQKLVEAMGVGVAPSERPLGLSRNAKDGTVDIVAWRPFRDGQPAAVVAYGQVASGRNWDTKPIGAYVKGHFMTWFAKPPSHQHIELLFIPVLQHHELRESSSEDYREVAREQARLREMDFGVVIDRLRLTELMAASKVGGRYDEAEYTNHEADAEAWVHEALAYASESGS